uniref:Uncharacterized protein n=1 Tax=Leersia perrieri TaxID=77586 RepID=A0A0D9XK11_9ORYZ
MAILHRCCRAAPPPPAATANQTRAPALFVFGDSIVDAGNNNAITTTVRCNFAPYGKDFPGHNATGRFSNGKVPGDILGNAICISLLSSSSMASCGLTLFDRECESSATQMGIKQYLPAYLGTELSEFDLLTGSVLTMDNQLDLFKEYKGKLHRVAGERRAGEIVSESLYMVVTGTDDLANTYFTTPFRRDYDLDSYIDYVKLLGMGARRVNIAGSPPIGCVPSQRTNAGGLERECVSLYNQAAVVYNARLEKEIEQLNGSDTAPPGTVLKYIDLYTPLLDMIQRPAAYGFEVTNRGCCGTGVFEVTLTCNRYTAHACRDVDKFLFWDTYHLTERGYNILLSQIINKYGF